MTLAEVLQSFQHLLAGQSGEEDFCFVLLCLRAEVHSLVFFITLIVLRVAGKALLIHVQREIYTIFDDIAESKR